MSITGNSLAIVATNQQSAVGSITHSTTGTVGSLGSDMGGVAIYAAGSIGSRVYNVQLSNNVAVVEVDVFLYVLNGSNVYPIGIFKVPNNAGNSSGNPSFDALNQANCPGLPCDFFGKPFIELAVNSILKFSVVNNLPANSTLYCNALGADY